MDDTVLRTKTKAKLKKIFKKLEDKLRETEKVLDSFEIVNQ